MAQSNQPNQPNPANQTWENTSLVPFVRNYFPCDDPEREVRRGRRCLNYLSRIEQNHHSVHRLVSEITRMPLNANGEPDRSYRPPFPNTNDDDGNFNRLIVIMMLMRHADRDGGGIDQGGIWLPPRPPGVAENQRADASSGTTPTYPRWTREAAVDLMPAANLNWQGQPSSSSSAGRGRGRGVPPSSTAQHSPSGCGQGRGQASGSNPTSPTRGGPAGLGHTSPASPSGGNYGPVGPPPQYGGSQSSRGGRGGSSGGQGRGRGRGGDPFRLW